MAEPVRSPRLRYVPGLDGIRAFAVVAVMAYHNFSWFPGGFYGVDAFFVLSGFLITSLLVSEWQGSGTVRLGTFWARRARRLLPALFVLVAGVGLVAAVWPSVFGPVDLLPTAVATVFYSANWFFIGHHANYFTALGPPSPLLHTWSLAIEEQFYLIWPLVVLAVLGTRHRARRRNTRASSEALRSAVPVVSAGDEPLTVAERERRLEWLFFLAVVGTAGSALLMAVLAPFGGTTTRAYYGTDTRAQALLVGAALAVAFARWGAVRGARGRRAVAALAVAGAVGTVVAWLTISFTSGLAFHGGFLLVSLATAAVIAGVVQTPGGAVSVILSWSPIRALGRISYGVYLWYWPVILVMTAERVHATGWALFGERISTTVGLAAVSYRVVETPVRRGLFLRWRGLVAAPLAAGVALAVVGVAALAAPGFSTATAAVGSTAVNSAAVSSGKRLSIGASTTQGAVLGAAGSTELGSSNVTAIAGVAHPVKVLVVGDSIAGSLGVGLEEEAARYHIELVDQGSPGCSVSMDQLIRVLWFTVPPATPCRPGDPAGLLEKWRSWIDSYNPDVVVYLARGETFDQEVSNQWLHLGEPAFNRYVTTRFSQAVRVLGSRGAEVVLLTTPYYDSGRQPNGTGWPEDNPARVGIDNAIMRRVAKAADVARSPGSTTVLDFGSLVSPSGHYQADVGSVDLRCTDGVHFTPAGGRWVAPRLLPELAALGRSHLEASPGGKWPGPAPPPVPSWYSKLPCR
ncbi:MAG: acyltransferase family protein [Acidimicrobiales bacterium]